MSRQVAPSMYRRIRWRLVDKLRVADSALESGWIKRTARIEGTVPKNVRRWIAQRDELRKQVAAYRVQGKTNCFKLKDNPNLRPSFGVEVDQALLEYYRELRVQNAPVSVRILIAKWSQLDPTTTASISPNAQRLRMYRFMKKNDITRRVVTHQAQNVFTSRIVIEDFVEYIYNKVELLGISWDAVANFDETNVYFAPETRYTLADKGSRTVSARKLPSSNQCSAMLGCTATGKLLPPFIIWQGSSKNTGRIIKECENPAEYGLCGGITYAVQEKAWMDEATMLKWVHTVWKPFADTIDGPKLLILDECPSHLTRAVRMALCLCNTELEVIPGGYTSKLQVMDVGLNKPFKDRMRNCVEQFIVSQPVGTKPTRKVVSHWIKKAWDDMDIVTVQNTWRHIGYTTEGIYVTRADDLSDDDSEPTYDPIALIVGPEEDTDDDNSIDLN